MKIHIYGSVAAAALFLGNPAMSFGGGAPKEPAEQADASGTEAVPEAPIGPQRKYNPGTVALFPAAITGIELKSGKATTVKQKRGRSTLVFFVASWCEPCQQLMPQIKNVAKKYEGRYTDILYVFAHDTREDASGFAKEHKLSGTMVLANHDILKSFKNPPLPAVYVGDRYNYLADRALKMTPADLAAIDDHLEKLTAL